MAVKRRRKKKIKGGVIAVVALVLTLAIGLGIWLLMPKSGFKNTDQGRKYYDAKAGSYLVGFQEIEGKKYYFDNSGVLKTGLVSVEGKKYYADSEGVLQSGWQEINGEKFYFGEDLLAANGIVMIGNNKHRFAEGKPISGLFVADKKLFYSDSEGKVIYGNQEIEGKNYTLSDNGAEINGRITVEGETYYFKNNLAQTGINRIDGKRYYFDQNGKMLKNTTVGFYQIGDDGVAKQMPASVENLDAYLDYYLEQYGTDEQSIYQIVRDIRNGQYKYYDRKPTYEETACDFINANGQGACWHFASMAYVLYKRAGYEVYYVEGIGRNYPNAHNWLYVKFNDGNFYYVDPTYAVHNGGNKMTDSDMKKWGYHSWEILEYSGEYWNGK